MDNLEKLTALARELPESISGNALGLIAEMSTPLEGIGDDPVEWRPSYLRLVQGTTDRGSLPKGTAIGDFVLGEQKLEQPLTFIPIRIWDSRQYWDPDQTNNRQLCWSPDAKFGYIGRECRGCPHAEWVEDKGNDCGKTKSAMVITSDLSKVFTINFSKSNYKIGTELESVMKRAGVAPYNRVYGLTSATSTTAKNVENFKIQVLDEKARRTPPELLPFLKELFDLVSASRKASVEAFYKIAFEKRDAALALASQPGPALVTDQSQTVITAATVAEGASTEVSNMSKSYSI